VLPQDWRKTPYAAPPLGDDYHRKAVAIYDTFLRPDASRPVRLDALDLAATGPAAGAAAGGMSVEAGVAAVARAKARAFVGYFRGQPARRDGFLRRAVGLPDRLQVRLSTRI
jgi:hypothetical protein